MLTDLSSGKSSKKIITFLKNGYGRQCGLKCMIVDPEANCLGSNPFFSIC